MSAVSLFRASVLGSTLFTPLLLLLSANPAAAQKAQLLAPVVPSGEVAPQPVPGKDQPEEKKGKEDLFKLDLDKLLQVPVSPSAPSTAAPTLSPQQLTSVGRQETTVGRSPSAVFIVTNEMIRRSGATSIPEVLRMVPGLDVARTNSNSWGVSSRGFNGSLVNKMLVQVDGRVVYNPIFSGVFWNTVDVMLQDVERIEVIRGPGATVWGANAVNGIINIVTKSAADTQGGLITGGGGYPERVSGGFRYGGKIGDDLYYRVYGKGLDMASFSGPAGSLNDGWQHGQVGLRLDWKPGERDTFTFQADTFDQQTGVLGTHPTLIPPAFAFRTAEKENFSGKDVLWRWSHKIDEKSDWRLQIYYDNFALHRTDTKFDINTFDLDFQHQFPLTARQQIIYGFGFRRENVVVQPVGPDTGINAIQSIPPTRDLNIVSAFIQDQITLVKDRLYLTVGSKFEHNTYTGFEYQPTARLLWTPTEKQSVWAAVSRAVRTPSLIEEQLLITGAPIPPVGAIPVFTQLQPNTGFLSETLIAYELGYRVQPTETVSLDFAVFANDYGRLEVFLPGKLTPLMAAVPAFIFPINIQNRMAGQTYGAEIAANWKVTEQWRLYAAYTFLDMQLHAEPTLPIGTITSSEAAARQSPSNQVFLQSSWDLTERLELDVMGRYVDGLSGFTPTVSQYFELDVRVGWKASKNLELSVLGMNLLSRQHVELGGGSPAQVPRGIYGMMTYRW